MSKWVSVRSLFLLLASAGASMAEPMRVSDTKGRAINIDLLELAADKVTFSIDGKNGEHVVPIDRFDESSQKKIREAAKTLKPRFPKLEMDVVIGKRRKKGSSSYMLTQNVTSKIQIKNASRKIPLPKSKAKIIFIGRDRKSGDFYAVLSADEFEIAIKPGKNFEFIPKAFVTSYDSDRRGTSNIGGYQYDSYVLAILDNEGNIIDQKTSDPSIRTIIDSQLVMASTLVSYPVGTLLTKEMAKTTDGPSIRR